MITRANNFSRQKVNFKGEIKPGLKREQITYQNAPITVPKIKKIIPFVLAACSFGAVITFFANITRSQPRPEPTGEKITFVFEATKPEIKRNVELTVQNFEPETEADFYKLRKEHPNARMYNIDPVKEATPSELVDIGNGVSMQKDAAKALKKMIDVAKKDNIDLVPLSGYRSEELQKSLFFDVAKEREQSLSERRLVSFPPGFSQHHTGKAVDFNSLEVSFDKTKEYKWLQAHSTTYGFELSYPKGQDHKAPNTAAYEPWHFYFNPSIK